MSEKALEIFKLCKKLAELLDEEEAIADLDFLYERHPEMFADKESVKLVIEKIVSNPDIIIKNPRARSEKDFIASKQLSSEKMGDVGIRNDKGTNIIFHTNYKKIEELERLYDKVEKNKVQVVGTPTSYTQAQSLDGLVENNISLAKETIPNPSLESQILSEEEKLLNEMLKTQEKINDMPRVKDFKESFEKDLEKSFNVKTCEENLQKDNEGNLKLRLKQ